jgi:peroxiredoxin
MTDRTIAEQVTAMHEGRATDDVWAREQADLALTTATVALDLGAEFPDGKLLGPTGEAASLTDVRAGAPAVVVFYRGVWCPYCNIALKTYQERLNPALRERGVVLVALSPQRPDGSLSMREKNEIDFAVLSDPGNQIAAALGILTKPSDASREAQLALGLDLTAVNGDGTIALPMPTVAIVAADGTLAWIDVRPDYSTRTEPRQILDALDALGL